MLCGCVLHQTLVALTRVSKHGSAMDHDLWADMENSSVFSIQHLQISSPKTFRQGPPPSLIVSKLQANLNLYRVKLCQPVPHRNFMWNTSIRYMNKHINALWKFFIYVYRVDILPDVNLNVLIVMQNLCEYSISCKNSKYEFYI